MGGMSGGMGNSPQVFQISNNPQGFGMGVNSGYANQGQMMPYDGNHMWRGSFHQIYSQILEMDLHIEGGNISGNGQDQVGIYHVAGRIMIQDQHKFSFYKAYENRLTYYYQGHFAQGYTKMEGHWGQSEGERDGVFELQRDM